MTSSSTGKRVDVTGDMELRDPTAKTGSFAGVFYEHGVSLAAHLKLSSIHRHADQESSSAHRSGGRLSCRLPNRTGTCESPDFVNVFGERAGGICVPDARMSGGMLAREVARDEELAARSEIDAPPLFRDPAKGEPLTFGGNDEIANVHGGGKGYRPVDFQMRRDARLQRLGRRCGLEWSRLVRVEDPLKQKILLSCGRLARLFAPRAVQSQGAVDQAFLDLGPVAKPVSRSSSGAPGALRIE